MSKANDLPVIVMNGEITGKPMYQVRGDPHWMSTPAQAKRVHAVLKRAEAEGYFKNSGRNKK